MAVKSIADIKPNKANPRRIKKDRLDKLAQYLTEYGDLSGVVYNTNPECEALVSGHQRTAEFKRQKAKLTILERYDPAQTDGTTARGFLETPTGQRYTYREVSWPKEKADAATIIANGQFGEWDSDILANAWDFDMPELRDFGVPEFVFGGDGMDGGISIDGEGVGDEFTLPSGDKAPFQQMTFTLADAQATVVKNAIDEIKKTDEYKFAETHGNENSNGNAIYLIVATWAGQRI